jgi:predicted anti-sigma-YlaC factor YlaD
MNCQLCQKESDAYFGGRLSDDMRTHVEAHLQSCEGCAESYYLQSLAEKVITREKAIEPDSYLTSRIMFRLENSEETPENITSPFTRVLKPVLIITSMAAAIFVGVLIGNIYNPPSRFSSRPVELALMDDVVIESVNILSNE